jgi:hypothetical protein
VVLIDWGRVRMLECVRYGNSHGGYYSLPRAYGRWRTKSPASLMLSRAFEDAGKRNYGFYFPAQFNGCGAERAVSTVSFG